MTIRLSRLALLLAVLLMALPVTLQAQQATGALFVPVDPATRSVPVSAPHVGAERSRVVTVNGEALAAVSASLSRGQVAHDPGVLLNLFDDVALLAVNQRLEARSAGAGTIWYGTIPSVPLSNVILVLGESGLTGRVMTPERTYYIEPLGDGLHSVTQVDPAAAARMPVVEDGIPVPQAAPQPRATGAGTRSDSGALIDVLVVYTPAAQAMLGSETATRAAIDEMIALTNQSYVNSGVTQRVRLVHAAPVNYVEAPQYYLNDLQRVTLVDTYMDQVHYLRDLYAADLVVLLTGTPPQLSNYCGIAWLNTGYMPAYGFAVVEAYCRATVAMPHELGHTMGSAHDPANAGGPVSWYPFSYGYQDRSTGPGDYADFVTVMAYGRNDQCPEVNPLYNVGVAPICPHVLYWSNPGMTLNGKPLGTINNDNVRSLNLTAYEVANYRQSSDAATELLENRDFEVIAPGFLPSGWALNVNSFKDRLHCLSSKAYSGGCSVRLLGEPGERSMVVQKIIPSPMLLAGDTLRFHGYVRSVETNATSYIDAFVYYLEGTMEKFKIAIPPGNGYYVKYEHPPIVLSKPVISIKFRVRFMSTSGRIFADTLSLTAARTGSPLPPP